MQISAEELLKAAAEATEKAYAPYSDFSVGAALLAEDGSVTTGCNVENASYGLTMCAERTALFTAVSNGLKKFTAVAIVAFSKAENMPYPCGACRQVLAEFCAADCKIYVAPIGDLAGFQEMTLGELLPKNFRL